MRLSFIHTYGHLAFVEATKFLDKAQENPNTKLDY